MFDCNYVYEKIMRMEREELDRNVDRESRYNLHPAEKKEIRRFRKIGMLMIFFRNIITK